LFEGEEEVQGIGREEEIQVPRSMKRKR